MSATFFLEAIFRAGSYAVLIGTVKDGILTPGMKFDLNGKKLEVEKIESTGRRLSSAPSGSKVGVSFVGITPLDIQQLKKFVTTTISLV